MLDQTSTIEKCIEPAIPVTIPKVLATLWCYLAISFGQALCGLALTCANLAEIKICMQVQWMQPKSTQAEWRPFIVALNWIFLWLAWIAGLFGHPTKSLHKFNLQQLVNPFGQSFTLASSRIKQNLPCMLTVRLSSSTVNASYHRLLSLKFLYSTPHHPGWKSWVATRCEMTYLSSEGCLNHPNIGCQLVRLDCFLAIYDWQ